MIYKAKYITHGTKFFVIGSVNDKKYKKDKNYNRLVTHKDGVVVYVPITKKLEHTSKRIIDKKEK